MRHIFADKTDLRAVGIFFRGDQSPLCQTSAADVIGRYRGKVVGGNNIMRVLLYAGVLPYILKVSFQFRVLLHIFPSLDREMHKFLVILHPFSGAVIGQSQLLIILNRLGKHKFVAASPPSVINVFKNACLILHPFPKTMVAEDRNILHVWIENQVFGIVSLVKLFDFLTVRRPHLLVKSKILIVQGVWVGKTTGSIIYDIQFYTLVVMVSIFWIISQ